MTTAAPAATDASGATSTRTTVPCSGERSSIMRPCLAPPGATRGASTHPVGPLGRNAEFRWSCRRALQLPLPAMGGSRYLDLINERVVVFDGAFGTYVQGLDLCADDFGGEALEGCNELLVLTRPDVITGMHDAIFKVDVDIMETTSLGSFSVPVAAIELADQAQEHQVASGRVASGVADAYG